jgi:hypothetical protein
VLKRDAAEDRLTAVREVQIVDDQAAHANRPCMKRRAAY